MSEAAIQFLKIHGDRTLVSLGCGKRLNRLDNHIKLMVKCRLDYYVAIDRVAGIEFNQALELFGRATNERDGRKKVSNSPASKVILEAGVRVQPRTQSPVYRSDMGI